MKTLSVFLVLSLFFARALSADLLITLPNGQIRGQELRTPENKSFFAFQGIPYARPPLGDLRFQAPVSADNWEGILDATKDGYGCPSRNYNSVSQSEDCLFINVYTSNLGKNASRNQELLPVMFWIYGGGFSSGSSAYSTFGPDYLIEEDIVFVSFNYRLGAFGFLSTADEVIPGNAGLKDQNLALQWTHQNIHLFGGDPNKITLFGESAGAASVMYHLLSPKSAGLFRAAIGQSGTVLCPWAINRDPKTYASQLVNLILMGNSTIIGESSNSTEILQILKYQTTETILARETQIPADPLLPLATPTLEVPHVDAFLTESSYKLLKSGHFSRVPILLGFNSEEYLTFIWSLQVLELIGDNYDNDIETLIPIDLTIEVTANRTKLAEEIKSIYLNNSQLFRDNLGELVRYGSDYIMTRGIIEHAELQSQFTPVYFYQFSYHGLLGRMQNHSIPGTLGDVGHTEEVYYLFKGKVGAVDSTDLTKFPKQDVLVGKKLIKLWTNFAKFLNPTPEPSVLLQNVVWPALKNQQCFHYLNISENLEVLEGFPRAGAYEKWKNIYNTWGVSSDEQNKTKTKTIIVLVLVSILHGQFWSWSCFYN